MRVLLLALVALGLMTIAEPAVQEPPQVNAEFPAFDATIWGRVRTGVVARRAGQALGQAPDDPNTLALLMQARRLDEALGVLGRIVEGHPEAMVAAFEVVSRGAYQFVEDQARGYAATVQEMVAKARTRLPNLSREEAARLEGVLFPVDVAVQRGRRSNVYREKLARFVEDYAGTEAARLAEVDLIGDQRFGPQRLDALDAFAREHPGTVAAAKAIYREGFDLAANGSAWGERAGADPTSRFLRVIEIVNELESGRYPACEWVEKAPTLVTREYHAFEPKYAPENIARTIEAYRGFVRTHLARDRTPPVDAYSGTIGLLIGKLPDLFAFQGDRMGGTERMFAEIEHDAPDPDAVRLARAIFYVLTATNEGLPASMTGAPAATPAERTLALDRAHASLAALSAESGGQATASPYPRRALATWASLELFLREDAKARDLYRQYVDRYPRSDWAWVAALRIGQMEEALGNLDAAATAYRAAATMDAAVEVPMARVLGYAFAARIDEARGQFDQALAADRRALQAWDDASGPAYALFIRQRAPEQAASGGLLSERRDQTEVRKQALADRIEQLARSLDLPGGPLLERGRWMLAHERWADARGAAEELIATYPKSLAAADARVLAHRARLETALQLASVENPQSDVATALRDLDVLAAEPIDAAVFTARIAKAVLVKKAGDDTGAQTLMTDSLNAWRIQRPRPASDVTGAATALDRDVAEVHRVVFQPTGGGIYGDEHWNAFNWPATMPPFLIVNPRITVKLAGGTSAPVALREPPLSNILFLDAEQLALFERVLNTLGGTKKRAWTHVMETPNQPIGPSLDILSFWNGFFAARAGHWGGWVLETFPIVTQIEFLNPERTEAAARVTVGYSGATVLLEKEGQTWRATALVNKWIT